MEDDYISLSFFSQSELLSSSLLPFSLTVQFLLEIHFCLTSKKGLESSLYSFFSSTLMKVSLFLKSHLQKSQMRSQTKEMLISLHYLADQLLGMQYLVKKSQMMGKYLTSVLVKFQRYATPPYFLQKQFLNIYSPYSKQHPLASLAKIRQQSYIFSLMYSPTLSRQTVITRSKGDLGVSFISCCCLDTLFRYQLTSLEEDYLFMRDWMGTCPKQFPSIYFKIFKSYFQTKLRVRFFKVSSSGFALSFLTMIPVFCVPLGCTPQCLVLTWVYSAGQERQRLPQPHWKSLPSSSLRDLLEDTLSSYALVRGFSSIYYYLRLCIQTNLTQHPSSDYLQSCFLNFIGAYYNDGRNCSEKMKKTQRVMCKDLQLQDRYI